MIKYTLLCLATLLLCAACSDLQDIKGLESDAEFAFPLIDSRIEMIDLVEDFDEQATLLVDADGLLRFFYKGDTTIRDSREIFDEINAALPPLIPVFDTITGFPISNSSLDVDSILFKGGLLQYSFFNRNSNSINVTVVIPEILKDGESLTQSVELAAFETLPLSAFDLEGAWLIPTNDSLTIRYDARTATGDRVLVEGFLMQPKDFDYAYAEGILGAQAFESGQDTLDIDYYDNWVGGSVLFDEPEVTLRIINSFGFPAIALAETFEVLTVDGEMFPLQSELIDAGFAFNYPTLDEIGATKSTQFVFDKDNSNIVDVIGAGPQAIIYDLDVITNPDADSRGFLTDSSYFAYIIDAEFPLKGRIRDFTISDTSSLDFSKYRNAETAEIKFIADNGIPLNTEVQAYFLDDKGTILDSLFQGSTNILPAATSDLDGNVLSNTEETTFITISAEQFDRIRAASLMVLNTSFSSPSGGKKIARITSGQNVAIRIGMKVGL